MQYFNKWAETTDKLITYLYKGSHTEVEIDEIIKTPRTHGDVADYSLIAAKNQSLITNKKESVFLNTLTSSFAMLI